MLSFQEKHKQFSISAKEETGFVFVSRKDKFQLLGLQKEY